jgi:sugar-phosphatase
VIVVVAGAAGSGKTTLGRELARALRLPLLDLDTITNPLLDGLGPVADPESGEPRHWNDPALRPTMRPARYAALRAVLADQRDSGVGAVLVAPFTAELRGGAEWDALVEAAGVVPKVVWLRADAATLAARRAQRGAERDSHIVDPSTDTPPTSARSASAGPSRRRRRSSSRCSPPGFSTSTGRSSTRRPP